MCQNTCLSTNNKALKQDSVLYFDCSKIIFSLNKQSFLQMVMLSGKMVINKSIVTRMKNLRIILQKKSQCQLVTQILQNDKGKSCRAHSEIFSAEKNQV